MAANGQNIPGALAAQPGGLANAAAPVAPVAGVQPAAAVVPVVPVAAFNVPRVRLRRVGVPIRRRRPVYSTAQKERAVRQLNMGMTCREVARGLGPHCSSGTPVRWRQQMNAAREGRARLAAAIQQAGQDALAAANVPAQ